MKRFLQYFILLCLPLFSLVSCNPYRELKKTEYLVNKTKIDLEFDSRKERKKHQEYLKKEDLYSILKQKPNKKFLGFMNVSTQLYVYGNRKNNWFRRWMKKLGDEPVILDTSLTSKSSEQLKLYLFKKGYFLGEVRDTTVYVDSVKRKAEIYYKLTPRQPYTIKQLPEYFMEDHNIHALVDSIVRNGSKIHIGENYDEMMLNAERERYEKAMKTRGYYNFDKRFVTYVVDSNLKNNQVAIQLKVSNPFEKRITESGKDTTIKFDHKIYSIEEVYIQVRSTDDRYSIIDTAELNGYVFVNSSKNSIRPSVVLRQLYFKPGDRYNLEHIQYSYNRLAALGAFSSISINVTPRTNNPNDTTLRAFLDLRLSARHSFISELEGTNRGGNLGINGNLRFLNKNTFKGGESFQIKVLGGLEAQGGGFTENPDETSQSNTPFNTIEYGIEAGFRIPELLIPKKDHKVPKYEKPSTDFTIAYNHQFRSAYDRDIVKTGIYYNWFMNRKHGFRLGIIDLSVVRIDKQPWFQQRLDESGNSLLQNQYNNHFISATRFQYEFTNQTVQEQRSFFYARTNIESAGSLLRALNEIGGRPRDSTGTYYELFGIRYAHYIMMDVDFRYNDRLNDHTRSVYRVFAGVGIPLANLNVLPFEKSYFGGGANFQRAWVSRTLGPGAMADTGSLAGTDRIGDIRLEANWEFRFDLVGNLQGAYFIDVGNIWIRQKDPQRPLAEFDINRFYRELAVGSGVGVRYNAGFFVVRFDVGVKIHDPKLITGERWVWQPKDSYELWKNKNYYREVVNWNLAIDYPF